MFGETISVGMNPVTFFNVANEIKKVSQKDTTVLNETRAEIAKNLEDIDEKFNILSKANDSISQEIERTMRRSGSNLRSLDEQSQDWTKFINTITGRNFLMVTLSAVENIKVCWRRLDEIAEDLKPGHILLSKDSEERGFDINEINADVLPKLGMEMQMNQPVINRFVSALRELESAPKQVIDICYGVAGSVEGYYKSLNHRHTVDGVAIHRDPIVTDLAICIYENLDSHGEIADGGVEPDEISAYSMMKAEALLQTINNPFIHNFIEKPSAFVDFIKDQVELIWKAVEKLHTEYRNTAKTIIYDNLGASSLRLPKQKRLYDYRPHLDDSLRALEVLNPSAIRAKEKKELLTPEERYEIEFQNKTIADIVNLLDQNASTKEIISYVFNRKKELRKYYQEEHSFYVCKIGGGNPFLGVAPGALQVVPGSKPNATLEDILGSGFDKVREFFYQVESAGKWHDLFLATSPNKTTDKSNVLLIGPAGSGKSEFMRAIANDKNSIAINAQGSDFLTCWAGEAQKNPKRLFEEALKLQKETKKHVHVTIDEIDAILNNDSSERSGYQNLTLEFQILMDGIVHYPHISIWGATNHPERIPAPMMRRFSLVEIVGELDEDDRAKLLQMFISNYLPTENLSYNDWLSLSNRVEGATGDILRKMADDLWRHKMHWFISNYPKDAESMIDYLNRDGVKFQLSNFDKYEREEFRNKLGNYFKVSKADIGETIEKHLNTHAVLHEIENAKTTYNNARNLLTKMQENM